VHFLLELQFEYPLQWVSGDVFIQLQLKTIKIMKKTYYLKDSLRSNANHFDPAIAVVCVLWDNPSKRCFFASTQQEYFVKPETITVKKL
jgi:hypothetical protein